MLNPVENRHHLNDPYVTTDHGQNERKQNIELCVLPFFSGIWFKPRSVGNLFFPRVLIESYRIYKMNGGIDTSMYHRSFYIVLVVTAKTT